MTRVRVFCYRGHYSSKKRSVTFWRSFTRTCAQYVVASVSFWLNLNGALATSLPLSAVLRVPCAAFERVDGNVCMPVCDDFAEPKKSTHALFSVPSYCNNIRIWLQLQHVGSVCINSGLLL